MKIPGRRSRFGGIAWTVLPGILFLIIALYSGSGTRASKDVDFFAFWLSGRMILDGQTPFDPTQWQHYHALYGSTWVEAGFFYPASMAILFIPISILPLPVASVAWRWVSQFFVAGSLRFLMSGWSPAKIKTHFAWLLVSAFLFRPFVADMVIGQNAPLFLICLAGATWLYERGHTRWSMLLLAVTALKPQLGVPLIGLVGLWLLVQHRVKAIVVLAGSIVGLYAVGFLVDPNWLAALIQTSLLKFATNPFTPTLRGATWALFPTRPMIANGIWLGASLMMSGCYLFWLVKHRAKIDFRHALGVAIPLTLILSPYLWNYDQLLLIIPMMLGIEALVCKNQPFLLTATVFLWVDVVSWALLLVAVRLGWDAWSVLLPCGILVLMWASGRLSYLSTGELTSANQTNSS